MINLIKEVGYYTLAIVIVIIFVVSGAAIWVVSAALGLFFAIAVVVAFVAFCIKEYCETEPADAHKGTTERESERNA